MRVPNTPGIFGYVLAVLASCVLFGLLLVAPVLRYYEFLDSVGVLTIYVPLAALGAATAGAVIWLPGVLVLHAACGRIANQGVHVAVAGLAGSLIVLPFVEGTAVEGLGAGGPTYLVAVVGVSAAVGRAAVVPLVRSRRRLAARGQLTGTARW